MRNPGDIVKHKVDGRSIVILSLYPRRDTSGIQHYLGVYATRTGEYKQANFYEVELQDE